MAREMKDIGIEWIGEIPKDWTVRRLRYMCNIATGNQDTQDNDPGGQYPFYVRSPIVEKSNKYTFEGPAILMSGDGVGAGRIFHMVDGKYGCHQRVYSIQDIRGIDRRVLFHYMSNLFWIMIETANSKSTVDSVRLNMLQDFPVLVPPKEEQEKLSRCLRDTVSRIDDIIFKTHASIEEYKKLKQAVITQAITKGVRGNREMKDSGIEWIGEIPADWEVVKMKNLGKCRNGLTYSPDNLVSKEEGTLVLRSSNIKDGKLSFVDNVYVNSEIKDDLMVEAGDILICSRNGSRALIGKNALIPEDLNASFGAFMMIFRCQAPKYVQMILNSAVFSYYLGTFLTSTINQLTADNFNNMKIVYCGDKFEQKEITDYLDKKCSEIDTLITKKEQIIVELENYKKSVIYEYVTGKKEVPETWV